MPDKTRTVPAATETYVTSFFSSAQYRVILYRLFPLLLITWEHPGKKKNARAKPRQTTVKLKFLKPLEMKAPGHRLNHLALALQTKLYH